jgi:serine/threonine-protein kinase
MVITQEPHGAGAGILSALTGDARLRTGEEAETRLQELLGPVDQHGHLELLALLRLEQLRCLQAGKLVHVEEYLARFPVLQNDPELVLDLVYGEVLVREQAGEAPALQEYLRRFPRYSAELTRQFALHDALGDDSDTDAPLSPSTLAAAEAFTGPMAPPGALTAPAPRTDQVPGFELLGEIGWGGMGVVYRARQQSLDRLVAVKMLRPGPDRGTRERARFRTEAEAAARLKHPHIVVVHEMGECASGPYLVMELLDGGSLARLVRDRPLTPGQAATLVEPLALAVAHAHAHGIVHRDLKPANVLLTTDGVPKISDFGLAKYLEDADGQTTAGEILGTPSYTAPEQTTGEGGVGPAADIYALGAILYELLTGRPPFRAPIPLLTIHAIQTREPRPPRSLRPNVPRDLEIICLKCLQKMPERRYPGAGQLANDLGRFLGGRPVQARPLSIWHRLWRGRPD